MNEIAMWVMYAVLHAPVGNHTDIWQYQVRGEEACRTAITELPKAAQQRAVCMPAQDFEKAQSALATWQDNRNSIKAR